MSPTYHHAMIHPSHRSEARSRQAYVLLLLGCLLVASVLPKGALQADWLRELPLHWVLEVTTVCVAVLVFAMGWTTQRHQPSLNVLWLSCLFLGVAILDFSHMLAVRGLHGDAEAGQVQNSIGFWLAARALAALALLGAGLIPWARRDGVPRAWMVLAVLAGVLCVHLGLWAWPEVFPALYVEGAGLTQLKIAVEYGLIALYLAAAWLFYRHLSQPRVFNASGLFAASCIMTMSEWFLVHYVDINDFYSLMGHVYKIAGYSILYQAIFVEMVQQPYRQLSASRHHLAATLHALPDALFELDARGVCMDVHARAPGPVGLADVLRKGWSISDVLPPDAAQVCLRAVEQARSEGVSRGAELALKLAGQQRYFELSVARKGEGLGDDECFLVLAVDITVRKAQDLVIGRLSQAVAQSPFPVLITDLQARVEYVNKAFTDCTGYTEADILGCNPRLLKSGKTPAAVYEAMWSCLASGQTWRGELVNRRKSGEEYIEAAVIYPLRDETGNVVNYLAHKEDVTAMRQAQERIRNLSYYDQLTGLPNRAMLETRFAQRKLQADRYQQPLTLLWLNIDNFKAINDSCGHEDGDQLLRELARRLQDQLGEEDVLARQSGDDFIILVTASETATVLALASRLMSTVQQPVWLGREEMSISASIGLAQYPGDGATFDAVLMCAESAMVHVKEEGRNGFRFYAPEMQAHSMRALAMVGALKQATSRGELRVVYQPQMSVDGQRLVGLEALLRWRSPQWGEVSPAEFMALAERNGLVVALGEWVLHDVVRQVRAWSQEGVDGFAVAVNLSAVQFGQPDLVARFVDVAASAGVAHERLEFELTEAAALRHPALARDTMRALREAGFRLSLDDFGTGYSSMGYLKQFAVHKLKIDQSFVRDVATNTEDQAIVTAMIHIAHSLGMTVIAEGVESEAQRAFLQSHGCDEVQGYLFSTPLEAQDVPAFTRRRTAFWEPVAPPATCTSAHEDFQSAGSSACTPG